MTRGNMSRWRAWQLMKLMMWWSEGCYYNPYTSTMDQTKFLFPKGSKLYTTENMYACDRLLCELRLYIQIKVPYE